jgi:hypothetical protein
MFDLHSATSFVDAHGSLNAELEVKLQKIKLQKTHDVDVNFIFFILFIFLYFFLESVMFLVIPGIVN